MAVRVWKDIEKDDIYLPGKSNKVLVYVKNFWMCKGYECGWIRPGLDIDVVLRVWRH